MWEREHVDRREFGEWRFELRGDEIADLAFRGRRVLRSIRGVVRDRDWNTIEWAIARGELQGDELLLQLRPTSPEIEVSAEVRVTARDDEFTVHFDAVAADAFHTNRTGLVVLHPPQVAGSALTVTHADGSIAASEFPRAISPHQPVQRIAALAWSDDGVEIDVQFGGDVFEMEDQRNWTDASFKTYSRPLSLPFPYLLTPGEHVVQTVRVRARELAPAAADAGADELVLRVAGVFPAVSVGASTAPAPTPHSPAVGTDLLVELDLAAQNWPAALERAAASGLPLDVRFVLTDDDTVDTLAVAADALRSHHLARVTAFWPTGAARHVSDAAAIALLRQALNAAGILVPIVGGARSHFTELNREHHRLPSGLEGCVFSVTPLFHSLDTEQAVESVAIQRLVARQAVQIAGATPVHIGPISLRPHFNDVATTPPPLPPSSDLTGGYGPELLLASDDPRQMSAELAAWTVASAAALAVPGVASLSYFEEWGARGIRSTDGDELPVAGAIRALAGLSGATLLSGESPDGLLWALGALGADGAETVLVANLDRRTRVVRVRSPERDHNLELAPQKWARVVG